MAVWDSLTATSNQVNVPFRMSTAASPDALGSPASQFVNITASPLIQLKVAAPKRESPIQREELPTRDPTNACSAAEVIETSFAPALLQLSRLEFQEPALDVRK